LLWTLGAEEATLAALYDVLREAAGEQGVRPVLAQRAEGRTEA